ncbi:hypothetical protein [Natrialbaceae archaeon AArc-T1-2]|uniref:hypothetical protein n=1 Tax=Natrialbaceae archaeon AArc-T1-2 TaxID=3053904 RepID=UPI00255B08C5|nr:hypothetical protein [Natrialbaceae archaeon AArc-T1-2]WIV67838.1 hypothetical protein QQ977_03660 [Natrialbaceae archaeon AArc-T1-2]
MTRDDGLSRRALLGLGGATAASALLAGCTGQGLLEDDPSVDTDESIYDDWEWNGVETDDEEEDEEEEEADDEEEDDEDDES